MDSGFTTSIQQSYGNEFIEGNSQDFTNAV